MGVIALIAIVVAFGRVAYRNVGANVAPSVALPASNQRPIQDCGPRALLLAAQEMGVTNPPSLAELTRIADVGQDGASMAGVTKAAQTIGLSATGVQMDADALSNLKTPALGWVDGNHFVAVLRVSTNLAGVTSALVHDPNKPDAETMTIPELLRRGGVLLILEKSPNPKGEI